jgi:hypothetical protein
MSAVPLIVRVTVAGAVHGRGSAEPTADEVALPPVVSIDPEGFALARLTKLTKVEQETTDDD